jgi:hypothetical protein
VVYAAVGRRLGYPIRLVRTKLHLFNRWDDETTGERFNIDGSAYRGVNSHPDEHYGAYWKYPVSKVARQLATTRPYVSCSPICFHHPPEMKKA